MSENKTLDKIFDDIIDEAAAAAAENLGKNMPEPEKVEFSEEHEKKMQKLFRKERNKLRLKKLSKYSKWAAAFLLAVIAASAAVIFSVEAWRIKVMNIFIEMKQNYSDVSFSEDDKGDTYTSDEISFGYIPQGFKLEIKEVSENRIFLQFKKNELEFRFSMTSIDGAMRIDTEDAAVRKLTVNGREAFYSTNKNINVLVWHDENFSYSLTGNIKEKEMIKIAENIKN